MAKTSVMLSSLAILGMILTTCAPAAPTQAPVPTASAPMPEVAQSTPSPVTAKPTPTLAPTPTRAAPIPTAPVTPVTEKPRYGGVLVFGQAGEVPHFDVHQVTTMRIQEPLAPAYSLLVQNDPLDVNRMTSDLAERWEMSPDGKLWTFYLRRGVKWHDGKPATSADVKATFDRIIWPPKGMVSPVKDMLLSVERIDTPDDYTVRFFLKFSQGSFLQMVAHPFNMIFPKHVLDTKGDMKKDIVGTGPFKFKEYIRGASFDLVKNPDYFIAGRPYLDGIRFYIIQDYAAVHAALKAGRIDMVYTENHNILGEVRTKMLQEYPLITEQRVPGPAIWGLAFNLRRKPFDDVRVRRALHLAIDRQAMIRAAAQGEGVVAGHMLTGPWAIPTEELLKMPGYRQPKDEDIAEAKRLLSKAGYPGGFKTDLLLRFDMKVYPDTSVVAQDALRKIGVEVTLIPVETAVYFALGTAYDFNLRADARFALVNDPDPYFGRDYTTGSGLNVGRYSNPKIDELFERQMRTADVTERKKLVSEMQRILEEDLPSATFYQNYNVAFLWRQVKNFTFQGNYLNQKMQDVWLAQ